MGAQPPHKRTGGNGGGDGSNNGGDRPAAPPFHARRPASTYYKPSVHQLTCRGAFHLQNHAPTKKKGARGGGGDTLHDGEDLEEVLKDTFVCNGIQSRLRHVADYPLARTKDEAVRWFEGTAAPMGLEVHIDEGHGDDDMDDDDRGGDDGGGGGDKRRGGTAVSHGRYLVVAPADVSFSSYGTTQVNVLTVQEVPVNPHEFAPRSLMQDPFGGFGFGGMLNPFGSLFGGFFGGGPPPGSGGGEVDPWFRPPGGEQDASADNATNSNNNNNQNGGEWPSSRGARSVSRSVSSSTRMERDDQGKRVVTTVTKTTIVDNQGGQRTETGTTKTPVDEGGRVETKKVVEADGTTVRESGGRGTSNRTDRRSAVPGRAVEAAAATHPHPSPAGQASTLEPGPTEVAVIATDCLLGVSISDSAIADPNGGGTPTPSPPPKDTANGKGSDTVAGWRKSEYLFRLGRFIPPFMVVNKYYQDKEEEERRRIEMRREYNALRERMKRGRWDKAKENDKDDNDATNKGVGTSRTPTESQDTPIADNLSTASSRAEYFLQRLSVQMGKNVDMMGTLSYAMARPDFPRKVCAGGQKIFENLGPTAERTGKLMGDVWEMWTGAFRGGQR